MVHFVPLWRRCTTTPNPQPHPISQPAMKTKITRALPPYQQKKIKIQKNDGVVSIALAAASQVPENDSHQNTHAQENRTIPVVVAAGSSRHKRTASNLSVDFNLSQPPEPEHWFPGLVQALNQPEDQDEPMDLPSDATVDALLETILAREKCYCSPDDR